MFGNNNNGLMRRWGELVWNDFEGNKTMFWKHLKRIMKAEQARDERVEDKNGQILRDGVEMRMRFAEYF